MLTEDYLPVLWNGAALVDAQSPRREDEILAAVN